MWNQMKLSKGMLLFLLLSHSIVTSSWAKSDDESNQLFIVGTVVQVANFSKCPIKIIQTYYETNSFDFEEDKENFKFKGKIPIYIGSNKILRPGNTINLALPQIPDEDIEVEWYHIDILTRIGLKKLKWKGTDELVQIIVNKYYNTHLKKIQDDREEIEEDNPRNTSRKNRKNRS